MPLWLQLLADQNRALQIRMLHRQAVPMGVKRCDDVELIHQVRRDVLPGI